MKCLRFAVTLFLFFLWVVTFIGCGGPIEAKKRAANSVRELSIARGAPTYAPIEFKNAMELWEKAEALMKKQKIKEAHAAYLEAKDSFEDAIWAIEAGKKLISEKEKAAVSLKQS